MNWNKHTDNDLFDHAYATLLDIGFKQVGKTVWLNRGHDILGLLIIPAALVYLGLYPQDNISWKLLFWGSIVIQIFLFLIRFTRPEMPHEMLHYGYKLHEALEIKNRQIHGLISRNRYFSRYLAIEDRLNIASHPVFLKTYMADKKEKTELLNQIYSYLIAERVTLFDFNEDIWSFKLYLWNEQKQLLEPVVSYCHDLHPSCDKTSRSWEKGEGHVGKAFKDGNAKITGDALVPSVKNFISVKNEKDYDDLMYRSFASIPVLVPDPESSGEKVLGVVVATSNTKDRFNEENCLVLEMLADKIGIILSSNNKGGQR